MPLQGSSPLGLQLETNMVPSSKIGSYQLINIGTSGGTMSGYTSLFGSNIQQNKSYVFPSGSESPSNDSLDITTVSIIDYLNTHNSMKVSYADFAYLRNIGVYPNNRLIIARRFQAGVGDDLTAESVKNVFPLSTLISWVPDNDDFISTEFGEEWDEAQASFKDILNDLGGDVLMGDNKGKQLGNFLSGGGDSVPFPGFTEGLQYEIFKSLGYTDTDASKIPSGNPNLIRQAMKRKTIGKSEAGSGLRCKFEIKMVVEYEQKFINGADPSLVYYDIIANALTFGTSESQFQFSKDVSSGLNEFLENIGSGDSTRVKKALIQFVGAIGNALKGIAERIKGELAKLKTFDEVKKSLLKLNNTILQGLVSKYKVKIMGVANALTGSPSAPWHVTVGNPKRPIFSSGDMLVESVKINMGKLLSFNDLPSSIKLELTLKSARNIGAQEIYRKFNCGKQRTYTRMVKSFVETDVQVSQSEIDDASKSIKEKNTSYGIVTGTGKNGQVLNEDVNNKAREIIPTGLQKLNPDYMFEQKTNNLVVKPDLSSIGLEKGSGLYVQNQNGGSILDTKTGKSLGQWLISDDKKTVIKDTFGKTIGTIDEDGKITK